MVSSVVGYKYRYSRLLVIVSPYNSTKRNKTIRRCAIMESRNSITFSTPKFTLRQKCK